MRVLAAVLALGLSAPVLAMDTYQSRFPNGPAPYSSPSFGVSNQMEELRRQQEEMRIEQERQRQAIERQRAIEYERHNRGDSGMRLNY